MKDVREANLSLLGEFLIISISHFVLLCNFMRKDFLWLFSDTICILYNLTSIDTEYREEKLQVDVAFKGY